ncbi:MAG: hypothetical protein AABW67_04595 [Nanoarchaeota archaeon]
MISRYKRPDRKDALSIINASKREMEFTLSLEVKENSASTIIKNIYECFRMLGDAILVSKGIVSQDHIEPLNELINLKIKTPRPLGLLSNLRILRHNINYYGYSPKIEEVKDIVLFAKECFNPILKEVLKIVNHQA